MIGRLLWGVAAGLMFAVMCLVAVVKTVVDRVLRRGCHARSRRAA